MTDLARVALLLTAGTGYQSPTGTDDALAHALSASPLGMADLVAAANEWADEADHWPAGAEFLSFAERVARRRAAEQRGNQAGGRCRECGGGGWVVTTGDHGESLTRPCSTCSPAAWERWDGGHFDSDHDRAHCDDEGCQKAVGHSLPLVRPSVRQETLDGLSVRDLIDKARDALGMPRG